MTIEEIKSLIKPADEGVKEMARTRQAALAKPPGSLGELENISVKFAGITGNVINKLEKCRVIVMCADNGICDEGVSSAPISVTNAQAGNMTRFKTGMSSLAHHFGDEVEVVDVGIATPYENEKILDRKIASGTKNFLVEPAMSRDEVLLAINAGIERVKAASETHVSIIGVGEMGIGNTTTSSAVLSVLTGLSVEDVTGRGGGLTDDAFVHKKEVIEKGIMMHQPNADDVIDVLSKVGGLDIAAMCGVYLGAAIYKVPAVIDGFISVVAALCASRISSDITDYIFPSHKSFEPGYMRAMEELGLSPYLLLEMRLGEGSGCPIAFRIIESALATMSDMAMFGEESEINDEYLNEIRKGDKFSV